jgi:hypothetical protein
LRNSIKTKIFNLKQKFKKTIIFDIVVIYRRWTRGYDHLKALVETNEYFHSDSHDKIKELAKKYNISIFIETGTFIGNALIGLKDSFKQLFSIELDYGIYKLAKKRLSSYEHVHIFHGDSSKLLPEILKNLKEPALFWLDAHYSSGVTARGELQTPVMQELSIIFSHHIKNHCILVDDVKDFNGLNDYPEIGALINYVDINSEGSYRARVDSGVFLIEPSN